MRRTRLDAEERRKAIVEAAMPLFARKGFAGATTREIARAAGVSEALVFQHFPSKAALYQEILRQGCQGDPGLATLASLPPSTETLVHMTQLMLDYFVMGGLGDPASRDIRHRLMLQSFLDDGEYARLVSAWCAESFHPLAHSCIRHAMAAGDLRSGIVPATPHFWFAQHVAAMIAYTHLAGPGTVPYGAETRAVLIEAARFVLRGLGLTEEAIERHLWREGPPRQTQPLAA
jgi:AcrR family transcriptional regulator